MKLKKTIATLFIGALLILTLPVYGFGTTVEQHFSTGGYNCKALSKNQSFSKQVQKEHTIYDIRFDFDLHGSTVQIPADCILKFSGGHIFNGKIIYNNTIIESSYKGVFDNIDVDGTIGNREVWLSWWELSYDREHNDAVRINQIVRAIDDCIFYYDIRQDVYVGAGKTDGSSEETIAFLNNKNLIVIQPTEFYTILRGRSTTGSVVRCNFNRFIRIDGMKVDGGNVYYKKSGENGIGVVGNEKALIENCMIRNCYNNCFDETANGTLVGNGYPEWGSGGKGIQIEGGAVAIQTTIRNNSIKSCYIGISNNASDNENVVMDGNCIDSCYMSIILMRLGGNGKRMNVNVSNTIISNNTGDVGVICMGNAVNVNMTNTQVKGDGKIKSILRGCCSYSNLQMIVSQECEYLIDAALYRDNPEGKEALNNYVKITADKGCDNLINTSTSVVSKKDGASYAEYIGGEFDMTIQGSVKKTPIVLPVKNKTTFFTVRVGEKIKTGGMDNINRKD